MWYTLHQPTVQYSTLLHKYVSFTLHYPESYYSIQQIYSVLKLTAFKLRRNHDKRLLPMTDHLNQQFAVEGNLQCQLGHCPVQRLEMQVGGKRLFPQDILFLQDRLHIDRGVLRLGQVPCGFTRKGIGELRVHLWRMSDETPFVTIEDQVGAVCSVPGTDLQNKLVSHSDFWASFLKKCQKLIFCVPDGHYWYRYVVVPVRLLLQSATFRIRRQPRHT